MQPAFLLKRLLRMSPPEVCYRLKQSLQTAGEYLLRDYYERRLNTGAGGSKGLNTLTAAAPGLPFDPGPAYQGESRERLLAKADNIMAQRLDLFGWEGCYVGPEIDYHRDYSSGKRAPDRLFGKAIDYRDTGLVGDIKYIWEINRQQFLLPLALAYRLTGAVRYLDSFRSYLTAWFAQNLFLLGVNWSSAMELGIRLLTWSLCWLLLADDIDDDLKLLWLNSVHQHCWFISRNLSAFSSANNHLLGEATGLWAASLIFPPVVTAGREANRQKKWQATAYRILVREWSRQHYGDGVNKEQALWYEHQVLDYGLLAGLLGRRYGMDFPHSFWELLERSLLHLAAMLDYGGHMPAIGDNDSGLAVDLGQELTGVYRSLLTTGAWLFGLPAPAAVAQTGSPTGQESVEPDSKTLFLLALGGHPSKKGMPVPASASPAHNRTPWPASFGQGGYYILGTHFGSAQEQKLIFDCGALGYLSLAAHGHADALAFVFSAFGEQVFIDAGTYAYHTHPLWRTYFRSTLAHNTLRVADVEQSVIAGSFMWSTHARAKLVSYTPYRQVKGYHTGYRRLAQRVTHKREIRFHPDSALWEIEDQVQGRGHYQIQLAFHCAPECQVTSKLSHCTIDFKKGLCLLEPPAGLAVSLHRGETMPPLGWHASSYRQKTPATTILMSGHVAKAATLLTCFRII